MKKIILSLLLLVLFSPSVSFAAKDISCVKSAIEKRENSIISAFGVFNTSMTSALEKRKNSLSDAWSKPESTERKTARKSVFTTFKSEKKSAISTYKSARKTAWSTFKSTVVGTCKVPEAASEESEKATEDSVV